MSERYRVLALMTGAQAAASMVQQAIGVLAPFFIMAFAINKAQLGAVLTAISAGTACFTAIGGIFADKLGERTMVAVAGGVMAVSLVAATVIPHYGWLVACMFVYGIGYAGSAPAGGRAIMLWFDRDRGFAMGVRQTGVPLGGFIGAIALPFFALHFGGYRGALLVSSVLVALPTLAAVLAYRTTSADRPPPASLRSIARGMGTLAADPRLIAVAATSMILVSVQLATNAFLTVTAINVVGLSTAVAATAFAISQLGAFSARLFWGWASDRYLRARRHLLLAAIAAAASLAALFVALLRPSLAPLMLPAAFFIGFTGAGWNGVMMAAVSEIAGAERAGSAIGLTGTLVFVASSIAPIAFGALADRTSLDTAWLATAAFTLLGTLPALALQRKLRAA